MTDWIQGRTYTAFSLALSDKYTLYVTVGQHTSGKITIRQVCSKLLGSFNDLMAGTLDLDSRFYNKLNKILVKIKTV